MEVLTKACDNGELKARIRQALWDTGSSKKTTVFDIFFHSDGYEGLV